MNSLYSCPSCQTRSSSYQTSEHPYHGFTPGEEAPPVPNGRDWLATCWHAAVVLACCSNRSNSQKHTILTGHSNKPKRSTMADRTSAASAPPMDDSDLYMCVSVVVRALGVDENPSIRQNQAKLRACHTRLLFLPQ